MKHEVKSGQTDYSVVVFIPDPASTDGSGKTGLVAADLTVSGVRVENDNDVTVTDYTSSLNNLSALTDAHADWGIKEVSSTLAPGLYRLDIADAIFASGAWSAVVYCMITSSAAAASPMEFTMVPVDPYTGVNASHIGGTAQTGRDLGTSVLLSNGTGTGQVKLSGGYMSPNWGDVANPTTTVGLSGTTVAAVSGAVGNVTGTVNANVTEFGSSSMALASLVSMLDTATGGPNLLADITGNLSGNVGAVTGTVGGVAGDVTGTIGGFTAGAKAELQTEANDAIVANRLDELLAADSDIDGAQPPAVGSVFHELMTKTAGSFTFDQTTDSLEAVRDRGDAAWLTATGFATSAEIADVPTVAEFEARTLPNADYFIVGDYTVPPTANANADALLARNVAGGSSIGRTIKEALAFLRNRWTVVGTTLTVYDTDDTTVLWTATVTATPGADPITGNNPA